MSKVDILSYIAIIIIFFVALPSIAYLAARGGW